MPPARPLLEDRPLFRSRDVDETRAFLGPFGLRFDPIGSASALGHGGVEALHNAHAAVAVGCPVTLVPRLSSGDPRMRHRGLSHHSATVLGLLLRPVEVPLASGIEAQTRAQIERASATGAGHQLVEVDVEGLLRSYPQSGLPAVTMSRSLAEDEDFFRSALAAGAALAQGLEGRAG